jgi:hypothetical protein
MKDCEAGPTATNLSSQWKGLAEIEAIPGEAGTKEKQESSCEDFF